MSRLLKAGALALGLCLALAAWAQAQQYQAPGAFVQNFDNGSIDWQKGLVTAVGIGAPPPDAENMAQARAMAVRAATVVARRNLLEIIKGVQIDSATTVENYMVTNDVIVSQVRGFLQNSQVLDRAYMSDGSVEVTVGIDLRGGFADVIIPKTMPFKPGPAPEPPAPAPAPETPGTTVTPEATAPEPPPTQVVHTGLLVDARGLSARPAMSPKILDENGNEVYGSSMVSREYAIQQGMAGYAKDETMAKENKRIADNPYTAKGVSTEGKSKTNIVISNDQANMIREMAKAQNFLEKCRVMILLD